MNTTPYAKANNMSAAQQKMSSALRKKKKGKKKKGRNNYMPMEDAIDSIGGHNFRPKPNKWK